VESWKHNWCNLNKSLTVSLFVLKVSSFGSHCAHLLEIMCAIRQCTVKNTDPFRVNVRQLTDVVNTRLVTYIPGSLLYTHAAEKCRRRSWDWDQKDGSCTPAVEGSGGGHNGTVSVVNNCICNVSTCFNLEYNRVLSLLLYKLCQFLKTCCHKVQQL